MKDEIENTPVYKYWKSRKEIVERVVKEYAVLEESESENENEGNEKKSDGSNDDHCDDSTGEADNDDDEVGEFVMSDEER
jgi:hypothetical protein